MGFEFTDCFWWQPFSKSYLDFWCSFSRFFRWSDGNAGFFRKKKCNIAVCSVDWSRSLVKDEHRSLTPPFLLFEWSDNDRTLEIGHGVCLLYIGSVLEVRSSICFSESVKPVIFGWMKRERIVHSLQWIYMQLSRKTVKICKGTIIFIQEETEPNLVINKAQTFRQHTWSVVFQQQLVM